MPCCAYYWAEENLMSGEKTSRTKGCRSWQSNLNCKLRGDYDDNVGRFYPFTGHEGP